MSEINYDEALFLTLESESEIYVEGQEEILDLRDLEVVARVYLREPGLQTYVIRYSANPELIGSVKAALKRAGVATKHVSVAIKDNSLFAAHIETHYRALVCEAL